MSSPRMTDAQYLAYLKRQRIDGANIAESFERTSRISPEHWPIVLRQQCIDAGLREPFREHIFHSTRGWRLDLAWPHIKLGIEVDGQVHRMKGRFYADMEKHNALVMLGWRYLRFSPREVETGEALKIIEQAFMVFVEYGYDPRDHDGLVQLESDEC